MSTIAQFWKFSHSYYYLAFTPDANSLKNWDGSKLNTLWKKCLLSEQEFEEGKQTR